MGRGAFFPFTCRGAVGWSKWGINWICPLKSVSEKKKRPGSRVHFSATCHHVLSDLLTHKVTCPTLSCVEFQSEWCWMTFLRRKQSAESFLNKYVRAGRVRGDVGHGAHTGSQVRPGHSEWKFISIWWLNGKAENTRQDREHPTALSEF